MTVIGTVRFVDAAQVERGKVEISVEDGMVTLTSERNCMVHRQHFAASAAEKIAAHLDRAADVARGES